MDKSVVNESVIEVKNLYKIFGDDPKAVLDGVKKGQSKSHLLKEKAHTLALNNINLSINKGEIFVIMGLSGSGKSTLIRHFNRLVEPTDGQILFSGVDVMKLSAKELENFRRKKMSMVFQNFSLMPHRRVIDNVAYGLEIQQLSKAERLIKAQEWIDNVGLTGYEDHYPYELSGGQQQRVGLARALCTDPEILLMDEAFSALDPLIRTEMQDQLIDLQLNLNKTIVFITHDLNEALKVGDKIAILKDGELIQQGRPEEILLKPKSDYVKAFIKDVNCAKVLKAQDLMERVSDHFVGKEVLPAIEFMQKIGQNYTFHVIDGEFKGMLTKDKLMKISSNKETVSIDQMMYELIEPVTLHSRVEDFLPHSIKQVYPLPVLDESNQLHGELKAESIAQLFN